MAQSTPKLPPYAKTALKISTVVSKEVLINGPLIVQIIKEGKVSTDLTHQELKELICKTESKDAWRAHQAAEALAKQKSVAEAKAKEAIKALEGQTDSNVDPPVDDPSAPAKPGPSRKRRCVSDGSSNSKSRSGSKVPSTAAKVMKKLNKKTHKPKNVTSPSRSPSPGLAVEDDEMDLDALL
uniref:Uncharacterized protein n=1 Tax=Panagrolaimus sp. PS1159 TaxID=55785 RepID=A0AC35GHJ6_9BILA